jgi:hypothetical protein
MRREYRLPIRAMMVITVFGMLSGWWWLILLCLYSVDETFKVIQGK